MSVKEVDFNKKNENMKIVILHSDGGNTEMICEYFGRMDGFENYVGFWKPDNDVPSLVLHDRVIQSIKILDNED